MRRRNLQFRTDPTPIALGCGVALGLGAFIGAIYLGMVNPWNQVFGRYDLIGTVEANPQSKTLGGSSSNLSIKFSVRLKTDEGDQIVNCDSTQCASLSPGDKPLMSCYHEWHWTVPNEVECRFSKLVP